MMRRRQASLTLPVTLGTIALATAVAIASRPPAARVVAPSIDHAFDAFWAAATPDQAAAATKAVLASGVSFDEAYRRLRAGRRYRGDAPRGVQQRVRRAVGGEFPYTVDVPATYDAAKRYQVRVQLHGGVGRPTAQRRGDGSIGSLAGAEQIYVMPQAWAGAEWWTAPQDENLPAILDAVKRTWNVDENRVVMAGVSDGGTAAFYVAMRDTTPYASFVPLNGFILVLRNRDLGLTGALFPENLRNKPFFAVNGGADPLYPAARVTPFMEHFAAAGLDLDYREVSEAGHNTAWWPVLKDDVEAFVAEHPRQPHPAQLTWQTDSVSGRNRAHWLVIDRLAPQGDVAPLPDLNDMPDGEDPGFGARTEGMRITDVAAGSNAATFGLRRGDVVARVNGRELPAGLDLGDYLGVFDPGAALQLDVTRGSGRVQLSGTYTPKPTARLTPIFQWTVPSGRVDLRRDGNTIHATTRGVSEFTLLLSPDVIDFTQPVTVVANGRPVPHGQVSTNLTTLLTWAARDNDRTMLYGAELHVVLPPR